MSLKSGVAYLAIISSLLGCGGSSVKNGSTNEVKTNTGTDFKTTLPTDETIAKSNDACKIFAATLDDAIKLHLSRKPSEKPALAKKAFELAGKSMLSYSKNVSQLMAAYLEKHPDDDYASCTPYVAMKEIIKDAVTKRTGKPPEDLKNLELSLLRMGLGNFMEVLDGVSMYYTDEYLAKLKGDDASYGVGIKFLNRSDYELGRVPDYLVIQDIWPSSANLSLKESLVGKHLLGFLINEGEFEKNKDKPKDDDMISFEGKRYLKPSAYESFEEFEAELNDLDASLDGDSLAVLIQDPDNPSIRFEQKLEVSKYDPLPIYAKWVPLQGEPNSFFVHLEISTFMQDQMDTELKNQSAQVIKDFLQEMSGLSITNIKGIVLDLRHNHGGLLTSAGELLSMFLKPGAVYSYSENITSKKTPKDNPKGMQNGKETTFTKDVIEHECSECFRGIRQVVVLVDRLSASASEVTLSALSDYKKAWIVGEPSYGKGIGMPPMPVAKPIGGYAIVDSFYLYGPAGKSFLMNPYFINTTVTDWINKSAYERAFKEMATYYGIELRLRKYQEDKSLAISLPTSPKAGLLKPNEDEPAWISDAATQRMKQLPPYTSATCTSNLTAPAREEDDCLLETATYYLKNLVEINTP